MSSALVAAAASRSSVQLLPAHLIASPITSLTSITTNFSVIDSWQPE